MKKWQIMRMFSGKQQTYNVETKKWSISNDRWSDTFDCDNETAKAYFNEAKAGFRKVSHVSHPKLYEVY